MSIYSDVQKFSEFIKQKEIVLEPIPPMKNEKIESLFYDLLLWLERKKLKT